MGSSRKSNRSILVHSSCSNCFSLECMKNKRVYRFTPCQPTRMAHLPAMGGQRRRGRERAVGLDYCGGVQWNEWPGSNSLHRLEICAQPWKTVSLKELILLLPSSLGRTVFFPILLCCIEHHLIETKSLWEHSYLLFLLESQTES